MIKIYVGCGLTHASEDFKQKVAELKNKLKTIPKVQVLDFLGMVEGTPRDVYNHDIDNCVRKCDIMVAICDEPSTGLGFEMATQISRGKRLLAFGHRDSKITRLILDPGLPHYSFYRYETFEDIYRIVDMMIKAKYVYVA